MRARPGLGKPLQEQLDCDTPRLLEWQCDGREMGGGHGGHGDVVEADNADLVWHADSPVGETAEDAERQQVVEGDDGRHLGRDGEIGSVLAGLEMGCEGSELGNLERPAARLRP